MKLKRRNFLKAAALWIPGTGFCQIVPTRRLNFSGGAGGAGGGGGGGGDTEVITGTSNSTQINGFDGGVGMSFIANANITVTALGRWIVSGDSGNHTVHIFNAGLSDLGNVSVHCSGATPGQFLYVNLGSPVSLTSGQRYRVQSDETSSSGDSWYLSSTVTYTSAIRTVGKWDGNSSTDGDPNDIIYGPVSFKYH